MDIFASEKISVEQIPDVIDPITRQFGTTDAAPSENIAAPTSVEAGQESNMTSPTLQNVVATVNLTCSLDLK
jgi:hypothetical protein